MVSPVTVKLSVCPAARGAGSPVAWVAEPQLPAVIGAVE
jgi:hypothetical protein